ACFVEKEGSDCWFKLPLKEFLSKDLRCPSCKGKNFSKGSDIIDVWFDSGISQQAVLKKRKELSFPADLYLEGSDQHRGWFQSSLIPSFCIDNKAPFKRVLTHGFVVDGKGMKMSKSLGNVVSPFDVIDDFGADILRLWVTSSDYREDIRLSKEILDRLSEAYRKIRNTIRFILSNLFDFNPDKDKVGYSYLKRIDRWCLYQLSLLVNNVKDSYERFEFYKVYKYIYDFCNIDLSMHYLDMIKGRLYTYPGDSLERRSAQTVIYEVLNCLVRMLSPILVFTTEEAYQNMPKNKEFISIKSVHLLEWPQLNPEWKKTDIKEELRIIFELIPISAKALEEVRSQGVIGSSFDAKIILLTNKDSYLSYLERLKEDLAEIFKVSEVEILKEEINENYPYRIEEIALLVKKADGLKCMRCWNYNLKVTKDNLQLCPRCLKIVEEYEKKAH
ncbi:MAG: class I tRNA ligase family protein, partial [Candidatus Omnitrophica bacterium]|nr:class I tRNA ligase family protein [Candidatus Omnitrophota bacterium]